MISEQDTLKYRQHVTRLLTDLHIEWVEEMCERTGESFVSLNAIFGAAAMIHGCVALGASAKRSQKECLRDASEAIAKYML